MAKRKPATSHSSGKPAARVERPPADRVALALAAVGLLITGYLSWIALSGTTPAFCASGGGCDLVQQSRWSRFLGIPIALWGFATYALIALTAALPAGKLRRWRRLWTLTFVGWGISLYLTLAGWLGLDTFCGWCLASLATLTALFVWVNMRRPDAAPGQPWLRFGAMQGLLLLGVLALLNIDHSGLLKPRPDPRLQALATHLKDSGAVFYGASWCPVCQQQKDLFGGAADHLPYIECSPDGRRGGFAFACVEAGIEGFPTWIIRDRRYTELLTPQELAKRSAFDWEGFKAGAD